MNLLARGRSARSADDGASSVDTQPTDKEGLGTFGGVFTPSILTILGVIMYLRFGWVVGNAGLGGTLLIVTIATTITLLTGLSIAQIATDQEVRTGGVYFMVSRSLGAEIGGAIGIPLYLAQALSVALYTLGFAESVNAIAPNIPIRPVALATTLGVTILALVSAKAAIRAQYVIMVAIVLSLVSLFAGSGSIVADGSEPIVAKVGFWAVFAVFFPAVTGIMAGVNMSGDLRSPRKSIPLGTLAAIAVSYAVYMVIPVMLSARADSASLVSDPLIMRRLAFWGPAILLGVWGATLSSALGSILGAPRILQALARDEILPRHLRFVGRGSGPNDEPRIGTYVSLAIALVTVAVGDLNAVAPILTMFFLASYAVVNLVSAGERLLKSPSFRPTFRVHWSLSFVGALGCIAVMVLINVLATIAALSIVMMIWLALHRRGARDRWGDVRQGVWLALARMSVRRIRPSSHARGWRPNILVLAGSPTKRWYLIELANALSAGRGLLTVATILPEPSDDQRKRQLAETVREHLAERDVDALVRVVSAPNAYAGSALLVEAYGLGGLVPNTVLLGDGQTTADPSAYATLIKRIHSAGRNVLIVRTGDDETFGDRSTIDVWVDGIRGNGALMVTLANTLRSDREWRRAELTVRVVVGHKGAADAVSSNLELVLEQARIRAEVKVLVDERPIRQVISERSSAPSLTIVGLPDPCNHDDFAERLDATMTDIRLGAAVAFVLGSSELDMAALLD